MSEYKEFTGKNLDEAIAQACSHYQLDRGKLEIEIMSGGSTGIFGLVGKKKAVIKARPRGAANLETERPARRESREERRPRPEQRPEPRPEPRQESRPTAEQAEPAPKPEPKPQPAPSAPAETARTEAGAPEAEAPESAEPAESAESREGGGRSGRGRRPRKPKPPRTQAPEAQAGPQGETGESRPERTAQEKADRKPRRPRGRGGRGGDRGGERGQEAGGQQREPRESREQRPPRQPRPAPAPVEEEPGKPLENQELAALITEAVTRLTEPIVGAVELELTQTPDRIKVRITDEEQAGILIGREGQTLNALQYLVNRIVSKQWSEPIKVQVDTGSYRERQDDKLRQMALFLADKAKSLGRPQSTKPLSSYHRRVVHMALQNDEEIQTRSKGEGPQKRVLILPRRDNGPDAGDLNEPEEYSNGPEMDQDYVNGDNGQFEGNGDTRAPEAIAESPAPESAPAPEAPAAPETPAEPEAPVEPAESQPPAASSEPNSVEPDPVEPDSVEPDSVEPDKGSQG